jgi:thioredoxin
MTLRSSLPLALALVLVACNEAPPAPTTATTPANQRASQPAVAVQHLGPAAFKAAAEQHQGLYLDVRTPGEVARGLIPGASNVDVMDARFDQKVKVLDRHRAIFVYCASGGRSRDAAERLVGMGFDKVYELTGGMMSWQREGLPVEAPTAAPEAAPGMTVEAFDAELKAQAVVLVDFQTPWCAPCKSMAPVVDELAKAYAGRARVLRVDVDRSEAIAAREKVEGVPVFALYVNGREQWRASGVTAKDTLTQKLDGALGPKPAASASASK